MNLPFHPLFTATTWVRGSEHVVGPYQVKSLEDTQWKYNEDKSGTYYRAESSVSGDGVGQGHWPSKSRDCGSR